MKMWRQTKVNRIHLPNARIACEMQVIQAFCRLSVLTAVQAFCGRDWLK